MDLFWSRTFIRPIHHHTLMNYIRDLIAQLVYYKQEEINTRSTLLHRIIFKPISKTEEGWEREQHFCWKTLTGQYADGRPKIGKAEKLKRQYKPFFTPRSVEGVKPTSYWSALSRGIAMHSSQCGHVANTYSTNCQMIIYKSRIYFGWYRVRQFWTSSEYG